MMVVRLCSSEGSKVVLKPTPGFFDKRTITWPCGGSTRPIRKGAKQRPSRYRMGMEIDSR